MGAGGRSLFIPEINVGMEIFVLFVRLLRFLSSNPLSLSLFLRPVQGLYEILVSLVDDPPHPIQRSVEKPITVREFFDHFPLPSEVIRRIRCSREPLAAESLSRIGLMSESLQCCFPP